MGFTENGYTVMGDNGLQPVPTIQNGNAIMTAIKILYGDGETVVLNEIDNIVEHVPAGTTGYMTFLAWGVITNNRAFHEAIYSLVQIGFDGRIMADAPQPNGLRIQRAGSLDDAERKRYGFTGDIHPSALVTVKYIAGRKYIQADIRKLDDGEYLKTP